MLCFGAIGSRKRKKMNSRT